MPDFKMTFPKWRRQVLGDVLPELHERGLDLLGGMLVYDPSHRLSGTSLRPTNLAHDPALAKASLNHPYFLSSLERIAQDPTLGSYNPAALSYNNTSSSAAAAASAAMNMNMSISSHGTKDVPGGGGGLMASPIA